MPQVPGRSWRNRLLALLRWTLLGLALAVVLTTPRFLTPGTLGTILPLASIVGVLAIGQAFVLIGGGFDLSQGATLAVAAAVTALLVGPLDQGLGLHPAVGAAAALGTGLSLGLVSGFFVAYVGTNPFVTTLSMLLVSRGLAFLLLGGQPVSQIHAFDLLGRGPEVSGTRIALRGFVFLAVAAVAWFVLRRMVVGRHLYATGGNPEAARLAGVRTRRLRLLSFALSGAAAGLAAILQLSWVRVAKPDTGLGLELDSIAACVVGGISLQGGRGSVLGAAAGCLLIQALGTWITVRGLPDEFRSLLTGAVILAFASVDALSRRE